MQNSIQIKSIEMFSLHGLTLNFVIKNIFSSHETQNQEDEEEEASRNHNLFNGATLLKEEIRKVVKIFLYIHYFHINFIHSGVNLILWMRFLDHHLSHHSFPVV